MTSFWPKTFRERIKVVLYNIHFATFIWRKNGLKISTKVSATFTRQLMSNYTKKMTQVLLKSIAMSIFLKFGMVKLLNSLQIVVDVENVLLEIKIFE